MGDNDPQGPGQFGTQGSDWQDLCRGTLNNATNYICKLWASWFISLWELMTPGFGQFGPQGFDWQDLCRGPLNIATY